MTTRKEELQEVDVSKVGSNMQWSSTPNIYAIDVSIEVLDELLSQSAFLRTKTKLKRSVDCQGQ
jgi:hypothetical protein